MNNIKKAVLAKEVDNTVLYIYPKTSADVIVYNGSTTSSDITNVEKMLDYIAENMVTQDGNKVLSEENFTTTMRRKLERLKEIDVDAEISDNSVNPVQSVVIKGYIDNKVEEINNTLTALGATVNTTLFVSRGGTGRTSLPSGEVLMGNGTNSVATIAIDNTAGGTENSQYLITSGAVNAVYQKTFEVYNDVLGGKLYGTINNSFTNTSNGKSIYSVVIPGFYDDFKNTNGIIIYVYTETTIPVNTNGIILDINSYHYELYLDKITSAKDLHGSIPSGSIIPLMYNGDSNNRRLYMLNSCYADLSSFANKAEIALCDSKENNIADTYIADITINSDGSLEIINGNGIPKNTTTTWRDITDDLNISDLNDKNALSARAGKVLNDKITKLEEASRHFILASQHTANFGSVSYISIHPKDENDEFVIYNDTNTNFTAAGYQTINTTSIPIESGKMYLANTSSTTSGGRTVLTISGTIKEISFSTILDLISSNATNITSNYNEIDRINNSKIIKDLSSFWHSDGSQYGYYDINSIDRRIINIDSILYFESNGNKYIRSQPIQNAGGNQCRINFTYSESGLQYVIAGSGVVEFYDLFYICKKIDDLESRVELLEQAIQP